MNRTARALIVLPLVLIGGCRLFVDAADESKTLYVFPLLGGGISSEYVTQNGGANLNGFFDVLAGGRGVIKVRTDIAGRESLRLVPIKNYQDDWNRHKCG